MIAADGKELIAIGTFNGWEYFLSKDSSPQMYAREVGKPWAPRFFCGHAYWTWNPSFGPVVDPGAVQAAYEAIAEQARTRFG